MILKDTVGLVVTFTVKRDGIPLDISTASTKNLLFNPPSGSLLTKAGTFVTDGTDGKLRYTTIAGDLDEAGVWEVAADIVMTGWDGQTSAERFMVHEVLS